MANMKVFTFKAPEELEEILRQVCFELKCKNQSVFIRKRIMNHPLVKAKFKKLQNTETNGNKENGTVQRPQS